MPAEGVRNDIYVDKCTVDALELLYSVLHRLRGATKEARSAPDSNVGICAIGTHLSQIVRYSESRIDGKNNVRLHHEGFARVIDGQVLDSGDERRESSEQVRNALVLVRGGASARELENVFGEGGDPFDDLEKGVSTARTKGRTVQLTM